MLCGRQAFGIVWWSQLKFQLLSLNEVFHVTQGSQTQTVNLAISLSMNQSIVMMPAFTQNRTTQMFVQSTEKLLTYFRLDCQPESPLPLVLNIIQLKITWTHLEISLLVSTSSSEGALRVELNKKELLQSTQALTSWPSCHLTHSSVGEEKRGGKHSIVSAPVLLLVPPGRRRDPALIGGALVILCCTETLEQDSSSCKCKTISAVPRHDN